MLLLMLSTLSALFHHLVVTRSLPAMTPPHRTRPPFQSPCGTCQNADGKSNSLELPLHLAKWCRRKGGWHLSSLACDDKRGSAQSPCAAWACEAFAGENADGKSNSLQAEEPRGRHPSSLVAGDQIGPICNSSTPWAPLIFEDLPLHVSYCLEKEREAGHAACIHTPLPFSLFLHDSQFRLLPPYIAIPSPTSRNVFKATDSINIFIQTSFLIRVTGP
jgi:hypothetical protein